MEFKLYSTSVSRVTCFKIQSLLLDDDNSFYNILIWNCLYSVCLYIRLYSIMYELERVRQPG